MFKNIIWILFQIFLAHRKNSTYRIKICWIQFQLIDSIKNWRFWTFSAKDASSTKTVYIVNLVSIWIWVFWFFLLHAVFFALCYSNLLINCHCKWYFFFINLSARNYLKSWRVTYRKSFVIWKGSKFSLILNLKIR